MALRNSNSFFEHGSEDHVVLARNPNTPFESLGQTSTFRFPVGKLKPLQATSKLTLKGEGSELLKG